MFRTGRRFLALLLLWLLLAACGVVAQSQQAARVAVSTPTLTATPGGSNISLVVPALPTSMPTPTPTARATVRPAGAFPPGTTLTARLEQQLFALINQDRAAQGLYAYVLNSTLSNGARQHSVRMSNPSCGMSHQCPGEPDPCTRETNEGISWMSCGENVGYTSPNPTDWGGVQGIEQDMLNEKPPDDGHRLNLLNSSYHRVGVGIYIDASGIVWITEDFAS